MAWTSLCDLDELNEGAGKYVEIGGFQLAVFLDGEGLFEARDGAIVPPGRFGLWSRADSLTNFGDLFITILD